MSQNLLTQNDKLVLTPYQEIFYLEWLQDPARSDYNIVMDSTVSGKIDLERFIKALEKLISENFIFSHNVINVNGELCWKKIEKNRNFIYHYPQELNDNELYRIISKPFDLENDLFLKVLLIDIDENRHRILFIFPHISIDGISTNEMYDEWAKYYNDENYSKSNKMPSQYETQNKLSNFFRKILADNKFEIDDFWKNRLKNASGIDLDFLKRVSIASPREFRYVSEQKFSITSDVLSDVKSLKTHKLTPYLFGQMVLAILMHKVSGNKCIGISYPIAIIEGKELPYGAHVNNMIIDYRFEHNTTLKVLIDRILSFFKDQKKTKAKYLPINEIIKYASDKSVLDVAFAQTFLRDHPIDLEGVTLEAVNHQFHIDLANKLLFEQEQYNNQLNYRIRYDDHIFDSALIANFISMYIKLFNEVLFDLNNGSVNKIVTDYDLLSSPESNKILVEWNNTDVPYPQNETLPELFEKQVNLYPDRNAFVFHDKIYTYKELNSHSNQVAHYLIKEHTVCPEEKVVLVMDRTEHMILSILGVLKSGAAYIPLDPDIPQERLKYILKITGAKLILTNHSLKDKFQDCSSEYTVIEVDRLDLSIMPSNTPKTNLEANNLAYIIFTSGTTGTPKGVMIEHSSAINLAINQGKLFGLAPSEEPINSLWYANYTFDAHVSEVFTTLGNGHSLYFIDGVDRTDILSLQSYIKHHQIDIATIPPVLLNKDTILPLKTLVVAGDITNLEVMNLYYNKGIKLINAYGPTEATVCATLHYYKEGDLNTNIGSPIGNSKIYVLDVDLKPLPVGLIGELYIGGDGVGRGYCNSEELTVASFIKNPFRSDADIQNKKNKRIYKTGDLARFLPDGTIEYIGRNDHQVKIRGYRIELGEIENRLIELAEINRVAAITRTNSTGNKYIAAYYIANTEIARSAIEDHLAQYLPDYMMPASYTCLHSFPTTINGKLDIKKLPAPEFTDSDNYVAASTDLEITICQFFADVINLDSSKIGIDDDFIHLGGDSISSIQLINKLRQAFDIRLSVKDIFKYKTVRTLASFVEEENNKKEKRVVLTEQGVLKDSLDLLPIQKWFFANIDENLFSGYNHWNQSFMLDVPQLDKQLLEKSLNILQEYHDAFHLRYSRSEGSYNSYGQYYQYPLKPISLEYLDVSSLATKSLNGILDQYQKGFDIFKGDIFHITYLDGYKNGRAKIHFALHHLIVDAVSWRIIKNDLERIYSYLEENKADLKATIDPKEILGEKSSSYRQWSSDILNYTNFKESEHWNQIVKETISYNKILDRKKDAKWNESSFVLDENFTNHLIGDIHSVYNTQVNDILLATLSSSLRNLTHEDQNFVTVEGHGREEIFAKTDINNTMGWFTTMYPISLKSYDKLEETLVYTKDEYKKIPYNGIGYGALIGYNNSELPRIGFNYLGQFDSPTQIGDRAWEFSNEYLGQTISPLNKDKNLISINCAIVNGSFQLYLGGYLSAQDLADFGNLFKENLKQLVDNLLSEKRKYLTTSDIGFIVDNDALNNIQKSKEVEGVFLANSLQQGFILHALSQGDIDEAYRTQLMWEYSSPIDETKLKQAWSYAQLKYPTLRLRFSWDEKILQIIDKKSSIDWRFFDISHQDKASQKLFVEDILRSDKLENYNLAESGLFRLYLIKKDESRYTCIFNNHHAIMDGWSNPVLLMFVHDCYLKLLRGENIDLTVDSAYSSTQAYLQTSQEDSLSFWSDYINKFDIAEDLSSLLKFDKRYIKLSEYKHIQSPQIAEVSITGTLFKSLKELCKSNNITFNALIQYGWQKQLSVYGGSDITVTGMTVSGRSMPIDNIEESVGLYINTLPAFLQHKDGRVIDNIKELQVHINDINSHSEVSLAKIQKGGERLFNTLFVFENYPLPRDFKSGKELSVQFQGISEKQDYPLVLTAYEQDNDATIKLQYAGELFETNTIEQILNSIVLLLEQLNNNESLTTQDIHYLDSTEHDQIINIFNSNRIENIASTTIHQMVEKQADLHPNNIAVDYEGNELSYNELNEDSNRLAEYLRDNYNIQPNDFVGLIVERSEKLPVAILAVLKAGGAYVPMDATAPEDRLNFMVEDSAPKVILTTLSSKARVEKALPESTILVIDELSFEAELKSKYSGKNIETAVSPHNLAYLIYTSGTTGMPKGVMIEHRTVINLLGSTDEMFKFNSDDVWTLFHSYIFDFSVWELWGAFFYGGKLLIPSYEQTRDMNIFYQLCSDKGVTVLNQTPSAFYQFSDIALLQSEKLDKLRYVVFGGEALNLEQLQPWYSVYKDNAPHLINMYGITETTVHVTYKKLQKNDLDKGSLIGTPLPNYSLYLLDKNMQPLPIGAIGEMYVGGEGVARGYLNRKELTIERFLPNPFQTEAEKIKGINSKLYRSGDLARFLPTGELEYIGRNDFQVKIRGFRIELGEIENRLSSYKDIKQSIIIVKEHTSGGKYLVGYYVADKEIESDILVDFMKAYLPDYMVPSVFVYLQQFPLTINGKLDRKALPEPSFIGNSNKIAPRNAVEERICNIYSDVLGVKDIGIDDDFFKLGGDSISSIQLISRLRQKLGIQIKVKDIFTFRTVKELYTNVILNSDSTTHRLSAEQGSLSGDAPLLPIQEWFFDNVAKDIYPNYNHWNQTFLIKVPTLDLEILKTSLNKLFNYHDTFKLRYKKDGDKFGQYYYPENIDINLARVDIKDLSSSEELDSILTNWQNNFDILNGKSFHVGYISGHEDGYNRIHFAFNHLIIDMVSWRIIKNDLQSIYKYLIDHKDVSPESIDTAQILGIKSNSYRQWTNAMQNYGSRPEYSNEKKYWDNCSEGVAEFNSNLRIKDKGVKSEVKFTLNKILTQQLLKDVNHVFGTDFNDIILSALSASIKSLTSLDNNYLLLEGHGRESVFPELDISNTIGWFTSLYPLKLSGNKTHDLDNIIINIKDHLKQIPNNGVGYGALSGYTSQELPLITFNYLGQFDGANENENQWSFVNEDIGQPVADENKDTALLSITGAILNGELNVFVAGSLSEQEIAGFAEAYKTKFEEIAKHLLSKQRSYLTPSDIDYIISDEWLNRIQKEREVEAIYKANSLQQGFIYHALNLGDVDNSYRTQLIWDYHSPIDEDKLRQAWSYAQQKYPTLRLRFGWDEDLIQIIDKKSTVDWRSLDVSSMSGAEQEEYIQKLIAKDKNISYDLSEGSLFRIYFIKKANNNYTCLLNNHHAILDGWSNPILLAYIHDTYLELTENKQVIVSEDHCYLNAQDYLQKHHFENHDFWDKYVDQVENTDELNALLKSEQKQINLSEYKFISDIQQETLIFDKEFSSCLKEYCSSLGVTLNAFLQYLWHKQLSVYQSSETTVVGMTVAGRNIPVEAIEQSAGLYINTLPLIVNHKDQKISESLREIQQNINDINERSTIDLAKLQKQGIRLFNTLFIFENYPSPDEQEKQSNLEFKFREVIEKQDYPLTVTAFEQNQEIIFKLQYAGELFDTETINNLLDRIKRIANQILENHDIEVKDLTYLSEKESDLILHEWNQTRVSYPTDKTFDALFEVQAVLTPDKIAVIHKETKLTYKELSDLSSLLAIYMRQELNVQTGDMVAMYLDRSENIIVSILAIMKAGAIYVPLDIQAPIDRIEYILSEIDAKVLISNKKNKPRLTNIEIEMSRIEIDRPSLWSDIKATCTDKEVLNFEKLSTNLIYTLFTSGTTGKPKGVMIEHHSYVNLLYSYKEQHFNDISSVSTLSTTNYVFDIWGLEYGLPLLSGGTIELSSSNFKDLDASKYDFIQMTPSVLSVKIEDINFNNPNLLILVGGEALTDALLTELLKQELKYVLNVYGPTETTIWSTDKINTKSDYSLSIGRPISNTSVYIVDKYLQAVPLGVIGELHIGGDGVGRGYLNNAELTAERFILNPFQSETEKTEGYNDIIYQTGDLVRYLPDGNIEYMGRNDFQVKIRGHRIELGEIEACLLTHTNVKQVVIIVKENEINKSLKYIIAYYISESELNSDELKIYLADRLPDYMVPTAYIRMAEFPVNASGKLNRKALPEPCLNSEKEYIAPKTKLDKCICQFYADTLSIPFEEVSIDEDFFRLGGDSILSIKLLGRINRELNKKIQLADLFKYRTVRTLAIHLDENLDEYLSIDKISVTDPTQQYLSYAQERLWFIDSFEEGTSNYNMPMTFKLNTTTNIEVILEAIQKVVNRHEVLRSFIKENVDGLGYQEVSNNRLKIEKYILNSLEELDENFKNDVNHIFKLDSEYPIRVCLYKLGDEFYMSIIVHHIAFDGWSIDVFISEINQLYKHYWYQKEGKAKESLQYELQPLSIQYKDFALWQRNYLNNGVLERELKYWRDKLDGFEPLNLKTDRFRPLSVDYTGHDIYFDLDAELSSKLRKLAKDNNVTLYSVLLSGFYLLLKSYSNQNDIVIGTAIANRNHVEVSELIGFFVNTLALRQEIDSKTSVIDFIQQVGEEINDAQYYQNLPFEKLVMELDIEEDSSRHPIFQVMFGLQRFGTEQEKDATLFEPYRSDSTFMEVAKFDLTLMIDDSEDTLKGSFNYAVSLFNPETIKNYIETYLQILNEFVGQQANLTIENLQVISDQQLAILDEWNRNEKLYPEDMTMSAMIEKQVELHPSSLAFVYEDKEYTYESLNSVSNQIANFLVEELDIKLEDRVALCLERTEYMMISILGTLKSGGTYVPIDTSVPNERIEYLIGDLQPKVILTNRIHKERLMEFGVEVIAVEDINFESYSKIQYQSGATSRNLAYIIYTSGTTGQPKGVMIEHRGVINTVLNQAILYGINESTHKKHLWYSNYVFDAHILDVFVPLFLGHTLFLISEDVRTDIYSLKQYIQTQNITLAVIPPALLDKDCILPLETLIVAGDVTRSELMNLYLENNINVINAYGPTEITVCSNGHRYKSGDLNTNIGSVYANTKVYILDETMQLVPIGGIGELYIGGVGLSRGYLNNTELTEERFLDNPFQTEQEKRNGINSKIYKTGDIVHFLPNGELNYMGRNDHQVKIRGIRIELGEIENTLIGYPGITQTVVTVKTVGNNKYIAAYYVSNSELEHSELENYLSKHLPNFMLPNSYTWLSELPRTVNDKLNVKALPEPDIKNNCSYIPPRTELELKLCEIFSTILQMDQSLIGTEDDFFRLGGNSILAMKLVHQINNTLDKNVKIAEIFSNKTIGQLVVLISVKGVSIKIEPIQVENSEDQILSFAQERLWFIGKLDKNSTAYNIPMVFKLKQSIELNNFLEAIRMVVHRHEVLRSFIRLSSKSTGYQQVIDDTEVPLSIDFLNVYSKKELDELILVALQYTFDLDSEYPIQVKVYEFNEEKYISIIVHHIAFDGWSADILLKEIQYSYKNIQLTKGGKEEEANKFTLPDLPIQYKDYALWQRKYLTGKVKEQQLKFWKDHLHDFQMLELPLDSPRPSKPDHIGNDLFFSLENDLSRDLRALSKNIGVSLYSILLSGSYLLMSAYCNQKDIVIGTPIANRNFTGVEDLIGFFVNTLAIRQKIDNKQSLKEFIKQVGRNVENVQRNQDLPFDILVNELGVAKDQSINPIFQVMFALQSFDKKNLSDIVETYEDKMNQLSVAKFDLSILIDDSEECISGSFNYSATIFRAETMQAFINTYKLILKQFVELNDASLVVPTISELQYVENNITVSNDSHTEDMWSNFEIN